MTQTEFAFTFDPAPQSVVVPDATVISPPATTDPAEPPGVPAIRRDPAPPALVADALTFADAMAHIDTRHDWSAGYRAVQRTNVRNVARAVLRLQARQRDEPVPDAASLDLSEIPFDIAWINGLLRGASHRAAGFASKKSFTNAKSGVRQIGPRAWQARAMPHAITGAGGRIRAAAGDHHPPEPARCPALHHLVA